jgi:RNA polymerase sigma-70 factor (ECF subfamily)
MRNSELDLVRKAQRGDSDAYSVIFDQHYPTIYRYCFYRLGDVKLAQDLTSEVFVRMVEKLDTFKPSGRPLLAWLYTIARNLIADDYRRNGKVTHLPLDEALTSGTHANPVTQTEQGLLADCLQRVMEKLTEDQRRVILLKFVENESNSQVARALGKTSGAVKSLQHRALASLRRALEEEPCYEA